MADECQTGDRDSGNLVPEPAVRERRVRERIVEIKTEAGRKQGQDRVEDRPA